MIAGKFVIPSGMASMLKMFGIDAKEIAGHVETVAAAVKEGAERLHRIEQKLDLLLEEKNGRQSDRAAGRQNGH